MSGVRSANDAPLYDLLKCSASIRHPHLAWPCRRTGQAVARGVADDLPRRGDPRAKIQIVAAHHEDAGVRVHAAAEVEYRARVEFHIVVVENPELEDGDLMIVEGACELDLSATWIRCCRVELVRRSHRDEPRVIARIDRLRILRTALRYVLNEIEPVDIGRGVLYLCYVGRTRNEFRVEDLVEVPRHQLETRLSGVKRLSVGVIVAHHD